MLTWGVYDKDLKQFVDLGGRKRLKSQAVAEMNQIKNTYKRVGFRIPRLEVRKKIIKYR